MALTAKHTPGRWGLQRGVSDIRITVRGFLIAKLKKLAHCWDEQEANACLISAAPDLLEALGEVLACFHSSPPTLTLSALEMADAAIAKAEGK
jgi:hypothetical protein